MVAQVVPELWGVPAMRHEGACASSSLGILSAMAEIEAGRYDCVLVLGAEEFKNLPGDQASQNQNSAAWQGHEDIDCKFMWPAVFGLLAQEYDARYGLDRKYLNRIAELNYANARRNPKAQTRNWQFDALSFTDDDAANPVIEPGTRRQDCGQITDGACAVVLASERFAKAHQARMGKSLSDLAHIAGWGHRNASLRARDKLERSRGQPYVFPHVRQTIEDAWRRAGVSGIDAMSGIETHDCFTIAEMLEYEAMGLAPHGQGARVILDGITRKDGKLPVNPSGGLKSRGHPIGATGVSQHVMAAMQLTGEAGDMQIANARVGAVFNMGGAAVANYLSILEAV